MLVETLAYILNAPASKVGLKKTIEACAESIEVIEHERKSYSKPAVIMDSELNKVTKVQVETTYDQEMRRIKGGEVVHKALIKYKFRNVIAFPRGFIANGTCVSCFRRPKIRELLKFGIPKYENGFYCGSYVGMRYFGHWTGDDLVTSLLRSEGEELYFPFNKSWHHSRQYIEILGIEGIFEEVCQFNRMSFVLDAGQTKNRIERYKKMRRKIGSMAAKTSFNGIYMYRGDTGEKRVVENEAELIGRLTSSGFGVVKTDDDLKKIISMSNGVPIIVGVEGSHMSHALFLIKENGVILQISLSDRFNNLFNDYANSIGFNYACCVAEKKQDRYFVDVDAVLETINLAQEFARTQ